MTSWILTVCFGMTFGLCNQIREFEYPSQDICYKAKESVMNQIGKGWAVCAPKGKAMTHIDTMEKVSELRALADRFSEGWHDGIKIDASDIMLLSQAASIIEAIATEESSATQEPVERTRCTLIENCKSCRHSVGRLTCSLANRDFDSVKRADSPPDWCPLPIYTHPQPKAEQEQKREPLLIGKESAEFAKWFNAVWFGDGEQGETIPTSGKEYDDYLSQYTLAFGAWMAAKEAPHGIKGQQ